MKITVLAFVMALAFGCICCAETTEEMVSSCRAISTVKVVGGQANLPQDFASGICWGAFGSIQKAITTVDPNTLKHFFDVCAPARSTRTQLIQIFLVYAQAHPEEYQKDYFVVALTSMQKAFPCPGS